MAEKKLNINTASIEELESLPMVGDTRAQYLVENRPYKDWDDVRLKVPSFSETMINDLKKGGATVE